MVPERHGAATGDAARHVAPLAARGLGAGAETIQLGNAPDEKAALRAAIERGLDADILVLSGGVYDDSCSFDAAACGKAYYDLVTVENRTLENRQDTVQGPVH